MIPVSSEFLFVKSCVFSSISGLLIVVIYFPSVHSDFFFLFIEAKLVAFPLFSLVEIFNLSYC